MMTSTPHVTSIWTVSELVQRIRDLLDRGMGDVWVAGEISNFKVPPSGHCYFSLKDADSQISAVMFRQASMRVPFRPQDGMDVIIRGRVSLYTVRGTLQLYVETMEPRGLGSLQLAFEQLKQLLAAEGLFAEDRKRPLPFVPRAVGLVTARTGAVIHDLLVVLRSRFPAVRIVLRPVRVQGREAPADIVDGIADLNTVPDIDVVIVARGGGSLEDLWAFNDERVARAIAASRIPVVSAVGHESDVTIADLVADRRAPTPTAAAAMVVPNRTELQAQVDRAARRLRQAAQARLGMWSDRLRVCARQLRDPRRIVHTLQQRVDELAERAQRAIIGQVRTTRQRLAAGTAHLQALSPLAVLHRGYAIARRGDGTVVRDAADLQLAEELSLTFARGQAAVRVERLP